MRVVRFAVAGLLLLGLAACEPSKEDMLKKAEGVSTKAELEKALGQPTDIAKLGPLERWTYKAKNGQVVFVITGDRVALQAAGESSEKKN